MNSALVPALALAGLLLVGCAARPEAGDASPRTTTPAAEPPVGAAEEDTPPELAFDEPDGAVPEVLRLALSRPGSLLPDGISLAEQEAVIVADLLYDGLTDISPEGTLVPALARSWSANDDFTRWRFDLDPDRTDMTAAQMAARFRDRLEPDAGAAASALLADVTDVVEVAGVSGAAGTDEVDAVGPAAVEIVLGRPNAGLPWLLASPSLALVDDDGDPTGVYTIGRQDESELVLVAVDGTGGPDRIEIRWTDSPEDAYRSLTLGQVDAAVAAAGSLEDARFRFGFEPQARAISRFYGMNTDSPVLADDRVRRAVLLAVDRDRIAEEVSGGSMLAADGLVAPNLVGARPGGCGDDCRHDPEAAAVLVAEVEAETGRPVVLGIAYGGEDQRLTARAMADDLQAVGVEAQLLQQTTEQLAGTIDTNVADLFAFGWVAGAGSIDAVVGPLLRSDSPTNGLSIQSDEVDQLIAQAAGTADDGTRWELLSQAHEAALAHHQVLPLVVATSTLVVAPQAAGLWVEPDGSIGIRHRQ